VPAYRREQKIQWWQLHGWINGDKPFEFLGFDMPVLRK
jgi:hypothetical protein